MLRHRTTAATLLALLLLAGLPATAHGHVPKRLVFPVVGKTWFYDDFGAPRGQGRHEGNDLMARWRSPVVAVERGRVRLYRGSWRAGCMLYLYGRSGTTYLYVHLNNDLTSGNDNRGGCKAGVAFAPGVRTGDRVRTGALLGYVGDSGDADGIHPHLHFELHPGDGRAVSPYRHLRRARKLLFAVPKRVESVRLRLKGKLVELDTEFVLRARQVRRVGTAWRSPIRRKLTLALAPDVVVERRRKRRRVPTTLAAAQPGERVTVWTSPVKPTLRAQRGLPGTLTVARVLLRGLPRR